MAELLRKEKVSMALAEVEFELTGEQYKRMDYPGIKQGHWLPVILDAGLLMPDLSSPSWFVVQQEPLPSAFQQIGRAAYAFTGQIVEADIIRDEGLETATIWLNCGVVHLRATCAPMDDGRLPYGTWETRTLTGVARLQGVIEDDYVSPIGRSTDMTVWGVRRLNLAPDDPNFGQWSESEELLPVPYQHDRIVVTAHIHRTGL
jgi:hypothetical protein